MDFILRTFYTDSEGKTDLLDECISFEAEIADGTNTWRFKWRLLALILVLINFVMTFIVFPVPLVGLLIFMTNWILCLTILICLLSLFWTMDLNTLQASKR